MGHADVVVLEPLGLPRVPTSETNYHPGPLALVSQRALKVDTPTMGRPGSSGSSKQGLGTLVDVDDLAHLPSGVFTANAAWLVLAVVAFNLTRAAGTRAAPKAGPSDHRDAAPKLFTHPPLHVDIDPWRVNTFQRRHPPNFGLEHTL